MLVVQREHGVSRHMLAEVLWGADNAKNLQNVRQAISRIKQELGEGALVISRSHCGFHSEFPVLDDFHSPALRRSQHFMPGQEGVWFDHVRSGSSEALLDCENPALPPFLSLLHYYSKRESDKLESLIRTDIDLVLSLPRLEILGLIEAMRKAVPSGWQAYLEASIAPEYRARKAHLRSASRQARSCYDLHLLFSTNCLVVEDLILGDRIDAAMRSIDLCEQVAQLIRKERALAHVHILRGLALYHAGDYDAGLRLLIEAERRYQDPDFLAHRRVIRSFLEVTIGKFEEAEQTLSLARSTSIWHSESLTAHIAALANLAIQLHNDRARGMDTLGPRVVDTVRFKQIRSLEIYSRELLAEAAAKEGDWQRARKEVQTASGLRALSGMNNTAWDRRRLAGVLAH